MNNKPLQIAVAVAKVSGAVTGVSSYFNLLPPQYLKYGVLVVAIASAIKEAALSLENFLQPNPSTQTTENPVK